MLDKLCFQNIFLYLQNKENFLPYGKHKTKPACIFQIDAKIMVILCKPMYRILSDVRMHADWANRTMSQQMEFDMMFLPSGEVNPEVLRVSNSNNLNLKQEQPLALIDSLVLIVSTNPCRSLL